MRKQKWRKKPISFLTMSNLRWKWHPRYFKIGICIDGYPDSKWEKFTEKRKSFFSKKKNESLILVCTSTQIDNNVKKNIKKIIETDEIKASMGRGCVSCLWMRIIIGKLLSIQFSIMADNMNWAHKQAQQPLIPLTITHRHTLPHSQQSNYIRNATNLSHSFLVYCCDWFAHKTVKKYFYFFFFIWMRFHFHTCHSQTYNGKILKVIYSLLYGGRL